jgi:hypothetical protein
VNPFLSEQYFPPPWYFKWLLRPLQEITLSTEFFQIVDDKYFLVEAGAPDE